MSIKQRVATGAAIAAGVIGVGTPLVALKGESHPQRGKLVRTYTEAAHRGIADVRAKRYFGYMGKVGARKVFERDARVPNDGTLYEPVEAEGKTLGVEPTFDIALLPPGVSRATRDRLKHKDGRPVTRSEARQYARVNGGVPGTDITPGRVMTDGVHVRAKRDPETGQLYIESPEEMEPFYHDMTKAAREAGTTLQEIVDKDKKIYAMAAMLLGHDLMPDPDVADFFYDVPRADVPPLTEPGLIEAKQARITYETIMRDKDPNPATPIPY